ncbi:hypothetical protein GY45DRAFT_1067277 [Cubamyces sp. BRFM 1775]|nr:hypothetical protein GY45DRAFT_1067277 [Cubamyces sp. BRFM 1775]
MACTPTPTLTEYELVTSSSLTTTFSESLTTTPPDVTTTFSTSCLVSSVDAVNKTTLCLTSTTMEVVSTIDGEVNTVQVPVVLTNIITTSQPNATLYAPCPTNNTGNGGSPKPPPSQPPSPPPVTQPSYPTGPVYISIFTPSPTVIVSEISSTLSNGSVFVSYYTFTSTLPPTPIFIPTSMSTSNDTSYHHSSSSGDDVGPIVGGVLGGFFGLIGLVAFVWFLCLRDRYAGSQFPEYEPTLYSPTRSRRGKGSSPPPGLEPKPYEYGLVGRPPSTPSHCSSPGTSPPPTRPQSFSALSAMTAYTPPPLTQPQPQQAQHNLSTPNLLHTTSPVAPPRPVTPMSPLTPPYLGHPRPSDSEASVGTAVSYPFPVLPSMPRAEDARASADEDASVSERRPMRLSLTLANWNPETDGELFARASSDEGRPGSVRSRAQGEGGP